LQQRFEPIVKKGRPISSPIVKKRKKKSSPHPTRKDVEEKDLRGRGGRRNNMFRKAATATGSTGEAPVGGELFAEREFSLGE